MDNISPIREGVVGSSINKSVDQYNKNIQWENPSIFMRNTEDSKISNELIFKTMYEDI